MVFDPSTAYANDYEFLPLVKDVTFTPKDAGGQGSTTYATKGSWEDENVADYSGRGFSSSTHDSAFVWWRGAATKPRNGFDRL